MANVHRAPQELFDRAKETYRGDGKINEAVARDVFKWVHAQDINIGDRIIVPDVDGSEAELIKTEEPSSEGTKQ